MKNLKALRECLIGIHIGVTFWFILKPIVKNIIKIPIIKKKIKKWLIKYSESDWYFFMYKMTKCYIDLTG